MSDAVNRSGWKPEQDSLVARFIRKFVFRRWTLIWLHRDLADPYGGRKQKNREAPSQIVAPITLESLERLHPYFENKRTGYKKLLESGAMGMAARDPSDGTLYGVMWVSTTDLFDDLYYRCWFRINSGEVLQFAGEIAPDRRGRLAAARVQQAVWNELLRKGYKRTVCVVDTRNTPSLALHFGLGFSERGMITDIYRFFRVFSVVRNRSYKGLKLENKFVRREALLSGKPGRSPKQRPET